MKREKLGNGGIVLRVGFNAEARGKMRMYVKMQEDRISSVVVSPAPASEDSCSYKTSTSLVEICIWWFCRMRTQRV